MYTWGRVYPSSLFQPKFTKSLKVMELDCAHLKYRSVRPPTYLSAYFEGKFNLHGSFWDVFPISATKGRMFIKTENAQKALKWVFIATLFFRQQMSPFSRFKIRQYHPFSPFFLTGASLNSGAH